MSQRADSLAAQTAQPESKFWIMVAVLLVADSMHFIFARMLKPYLPPIAGSFYYMSLALVQIALFAAMRGKIDWQAFRANARFFVAIGFLIAISTSTSYVAIEYIDPGTASMLARVGTIFALGLGYFWLHERLDRPQKIGAALAIFGVFVISFQPGGERSSLWLGSLMVLVSTFCYALHAALVKRHGGGIDLVNFMLFRLATSVFFLFVFTTVSGQLVWPSGWNVWLILLLAATVNVSISRSLYYIVLRRVDLSVLTILLTLSPVLTILWSILLFEERPSLQGLLGGALVIAGVILVTMARRK